MGLQSQCLHPSGRACKSTCEEQEKTAVDTQTRHALKTNSFVEAAASSASWLSGHRSGVVRWTVGVVVVVVLGLGALVYSNYRSIAADSALGAAMDTYNAQLAEPGAPPEPGVYSSAADRAREANRQFVAVAKEYSWLPDGKKARYFAGVTEEELGQTASAEADLKAAAGAWDRNLSNLAKLALAGLYHGTGRDSQAVDLYNGLIAKPSETVSAGMAQLDLADLYAAQGNVAQARALWAKVKDADKDGAAGSIAAQKLGAQ
jgi:tetratricopeptide (TPR) repeat protein